mgnify:CR=1 FL=1
MVHRADARGHEVPQEDLDEHQEHHADENDGDGRVLDERHGLRFQLRAIALGRKNYLFAGSHEAARRAAVLYSITRTCALRGIEPLAYLNIQNGYMLGQGTQIAPAWLSR